jgi:hypothetical protein
MATNDSPLRHREDARGPRRPAVRADRLAGQRPEAVQVQRVRALPEERSRDAPPVSRGGGGVRQHAVGGRALRPGDRVRQAGAAATSRCPRASRPTPSYLRHLTYEGAHMRWGGDPRCPRCASASSTSCRIENMGFSSYFLITWDLIKHARTRHPRRPRAWARPPVVRWRTACASPSSTRSVRPAVRAVPQPEPYLDARHRHGLRLPLPRRDDPLRGRALRPRPRCPDRDVRHDQGPGNAVRDAARVLGYPYGWATRWPRPCRRW